MICIIYLYTIQNSSVSAARQVSAARDARVHGTQDAAQEEPAGNENQETTYTCIY
jgi:hypothetical protein